MTFYLALGFSLLFSSLSLAVERNENYELLEPREKQLLETGIEESSLPSLCGQTKFYADHARWNPQLPNESPDIVLVDKARRLIHLILRDEVLATYQVALGGNPSGPKMSEGDQKTPEGIYFVDLKNKKSDFHLSLRINYPNPKDLTNAKKKGITDPGKDIMIHGLPNSWFKRKFIRHPRDWTKGCVAVTDEQITQIFKHVDVGTLVEICP